MASSLQFVRRYHTLEWLKDQALASFDIDRSCWTESQKTACDALVDLINSPHFACIGQDYKQVRIKQTCRLIALIGTVFFQDGLDGIEAFWLDCLPTRENTAFFSAAGDSGGTIVFNLTNRYWYQLAIDERLCAFVSTLLHECAHIYFLRFCRSELRQNTTGHYGTWQLVTEALERHARVVLDMHVDLNRADSFLLEYQKYNKLNLSQEDMKKCFDNSIVYFEVTRMLIDMRGASSDEDQEVIGELQHLLSQPGLAPETVKAIFNDVLKDEEVEGRGEEA